MTQTKSHIPKIRFKEFSWEWEEKKLWEVLTIWSWRDYKHLENWKYPVYWTWWYMLSVSDYLYDWESVCIWRKWTIDKPRFLTWKFWTVDTLFYTYSFVESLPKYVFYIFNTINWQEYNEASWVPSLSKNTLNNIKLFLPSLPEQQKIASFLSSVDEKIEKIKEKKKNLEEYKKWVMQKIFSQEIRFKDENWKEFGEWEEKRFNEILESISTKNYQIYNSEILENWDFKVVDQWQNKISWYSNNENKLYKYWPVIIFWDHTTVLKYIDFDFVIWADWTKILKNKIWNLNYLYYFLDFNKIQPEWYKRHFSILKEFQILFPTLKEQEKIADFLSGIDEKIEKVSDELGKMEEFKKGLLQGMFV